MDLGPKKCTKCVRYNWKFVTTEFVITKFHCINKLWVFDQMYFNTECYSIMAFTIFLFFEARRGCSDQTFCLSDFYLNLNLFDMCIHVVRLVKDLIEQESSMGKAECAFS